MRRRLLTAAALGAVAALTVRSATADGPAADAPKAFAQADVDFYEKEVRPVLAAHCLKCHGADEEKIKGGFSLATREGAGGRGESGPAVDL
jgi:mono/diheme cytochrome c family protein